MQSKINSDEIKCVQWLTLKRKLLNLKAEQHNSEMKKLNKKSRKEQESIELGRMLGCFK